MIERLDKLLHADLTGLLHVPLKRLAMAAWRGTKGRFLAARRWLVEFRLRRQKRRIADGRCPRCDYNLRGSLWVCPECGGEIPRAALLKHLIIEGPARPHGSVHRRRWHVRHSQAG